MACSAGVGGLLPREAEEGPGVDMRVQSLGVQFIGRSWARRRCELNFSYKNTKITTNC